MANLEHPPEAKLSPDVSVGQRHIPPRADNGIYWRQKIA